MKYLSQISQEFTKEARKWTDLTLDQQKDYLRRHPKSERRLSPRPEHKFRKPALIPAQSFTTTDRYQSPSVKPVLAALKEKGFRISELAITKGRGFGRTRRHRPIKPPKTTDFDFTLSRNGKHYAVHIWTIQADPSISNDPYKASLTLYKKKKRPVSFPFKELFSGTIDIRTAADTIDAYTSKKSKS
jgi:hypothetical protein